jgi:hypothetical protein
VKDIPNFLLALAITLTLAPKARAQVQLNWFAANVGGNGTPVIEDDLSGSPTATLINVPTQITFSNIYFFVSTADSNTADFYDLGIGQCANNDCSQPNQRIAIVCNLGTPGPSGQGVNLTSLGPQHYPCAQGSVTIGPGVYVLLGAGNANLTHCYGEHGASPDVPFTAAPTGIAKNGSLTNTSGFATAKPGSKGPGNGCMISLH